MGRRDDLIACFRDTMELIRTEPLAPSVRATCAATRVIDADERLEEGAAKGGATLVRVTRERTFEAAARLVGEGAPGRIAVLNFASPTTPGGGVLRGSTAQEECLCRCSTLYPALNQACCWDGYYQPNRERRDTLATDACIYAPDVVVVKEDGAMPVALAEEDRFVVDVITCAAPNLRYTSITDDELMSIHVRRAMRILEVAASLGVRTLVSGAFGCGAFANDARVVADAWSRALDAAEGLLERVDFAVWCPPHDSTNYDVFAGRMGKRG